MPMSPRPSLTPVSRKPAPEVLSLDAAIRRVADQDPDRQFIRDLREPGRDVTMSYGEAEHRIERLSRRIAALPAPVVGVMLSTSSDCLCLVYATMRAGKDVLLLDPEWGVLAQQAVAREVGLGAVVADFPVTGPLAKLQAALDLRPEAEAGDTGETGPAVDPRAAERTRILIFTSGTTSRPKGIVLTQQAMLAAYDIGRRCLGTDSRTHAGCFYRISGLGILGIHFLFPQLFGGSVTILPAFAYVDGDALWRMVRDCGINFLYIVPPIVNFLVKEGVPPTSPFADDSLLCVAGSARLDPEMQRRFQERFAPLANIYGLSECGFAFLFGHRRGDRFDNSVGPAVGLELKITDEQGHVLTEPRAKGRLHVRTPSLFEGYLHNSELTRRSVQDGWLDTHDLAWFDEDGCVHVVGRMDATVNKAGNLFHLAECEEALTALGQVVEAACVKVACPLNDEDYVAVVRTATDGAPYDYAHYLEHALGVARAPRQVLLVSDELPRNGAGKYDRAALMRLVDA